MGRVVTPIAATVEHITAPKDGQYGPYQSVLFKTPTGEKIWKSFAPNSAELTQLQKGTTVQLIPAGERNDRPSHQIVVTHEGKGDCEGHHLGGELTPDQKRAIATHVQEMAALYKFCWEQASVQLRDLAQQEESVKCAASSLFIAAQRKFGL